MGHFRFSIGDDDYDGDVDGADLAMIANEASAHSLSEFAPTFGLSNY